LPSVIEMHNLTPAHNLQQKLGNWGMLNSRVFSKFGLNVPLNISQNIANCKPGYIEVFLYNLRIKIDDKLLEYERQLTRRQSKASQSPRLSIQMSSPVSVSSKNKTAAFQMRIEYEEKVQECLQQAEEIEILSAKVRRLEHLLGLKDSKINDLTERLDKFRPTGFMSKSSSLLQSSSLLPKKHSVTANGMKDRHSIAI